MVHACMFEKYYPSMYECGDTAKPRLDLTDCSAHLCAPVIRARSIHIAWAHVLAVRSSKSLIATKTVHAVETGQAAARRPPPRGSLTLKPISLCWQVLGTSIDVVSITRHGYLFRLLLSSILSWHFHSIFVSLKTGLMN